MGEGVDFRTGILLTEPPFPQILISLPVRFHLNFVSSRTPNSLVTPELAGRWPPWFPSLPKGFFPAIPPTVSNQAYTPLWCHNVWDRAQGTGPTPPPPSK